MWFISDQHFGHHNIIKYQGRPFSNVKEMDEYMITKHNETVKDDDIVYMVGDFCMDTNAERVKKYVSQLKGTKILILGNHDNLRPFTYVNIGFQSVHTMLEVEDMVLVHDPSVASVFFDTICVCGHVHRLFQKTGNVYNVSVEVNDYTPVSIDTIKYVMEEFMIRQMKTVELPEAYE